jgi:hypothetical protein
MEFMMRFSMNGFRRNLSEDVENLRDLVQSVINDEDYDKEDLVDAINNVICQSNSLNCVSIDGNDDFSLMEDIEVELIELEN